MPAVFLNDTYISLFQHPRLKPRSNPRWRERENHSSYRLPPRWAELKLNPDHFVSMAEDLTKLTWFPDENCGALDRRRVIAPAEYLKRFFPELDHEPYLLYLKPTDLKITETAEDAVWVYATRDLSNTLSGSMSCMTGDKGAKGYSAPGNCRVAYLTHDGTTVLARAVVNIEFKTHSHIYALRDPGTRDKMALALHAAGFSSNINQSQNRLASSPTYCDFDHSIAERSPP